MVSTLSRSNVEAVLVGGSIPRFTDRQLRNFRGNFCSIRIPGLDKYRKDRPDNLLFTPAYVVYGSTDRARCRSEYRKRNLTHFPISLFPSDIYHGLYDYWNGNNVNSLLTELLRDGLIPVGFEWSDGFENNPIVDPNLVPIVVPQWEMNGPCENDTSRINELILETRKRYPKSLLYPHFSPGHAAGGEPEAEWWVWARDVAKCRGILYQHGNDTDPKDCFDRCADFLVRFQGYNGWPVGLDFVLFEWLAYNNFWYGMTEEETVMLNDKVLAFQPAIQGPYVGYFSGFCSGGK